MSEIQGVGTSIPVGIGTTPQAGATQSSSQTADLAQATVASPVDQADVGATQNLLTTILQAANDAPAVDESKVSALQQSIAGGTYQIDPMAIAKKLMGLDSGSESDGGGQ